MKNTFKKIKTCSACGDIKADDCKTFFCPACQKKLDLIGQGKSPFPALDKASKKR